MRRRQELLDALADSDESELPETFPSVTSKRKAVRPKKATAPGRETRYVTPRHKAR